nr:hypothetical protein [Tanacetum cinerariifolium]
MPKVLSRAWEIFFEIQHAQPEDTHKLLSKRIEDLQIISEELAEYINSPCWNCPTFYDDDDDEYSIQYKEYLENSSNEIAPVLPTEEPNNSLSIGDEHLSIIPETESDDVIKSSVKKLVPIPSESEVTFENESECYVPVNDESSPIFTTFSNPLFDCNDDFISSDDESLSNEDVPMENFKFYSNPLFDDEEIISTKIDPHYFNVESDLIESLLNQDTLIDSSSKIDFLLEEFSGELAHIDPIPLGIEEADFDQEEEIRLVENLLYDNSSPRPLKELNAKIADTILESLSSSSILVEDSDSQMEEIDLFLDTDDLMPLGIKNDDYDLEGDIHFLDELLSNDYFPLPENESSNFDHHDDPSFSHPPPKPRDVLFDFKPDTGVLIVKVVEDISEHHVLMPKVLPSQPTICPNINILLSFSFENDDDQSLSDEDVREKIYSNPLFDEEIIPMEIDSHSFNAKSGLIESLPNHDSSVIISSKIGSLFDEFAGELTLLKSFPPRIDETDCIEEDDDYDSERDISILEELLDNYSLSLPATESYHFDIPSPYRPPAK